MSTEKVVPTVPNGTFIVVDILHRFNAAADDDDQRLYFDGGS